jgi:hypothetical protein
MSLLVSTNSENEGKGYDILTHQRNQRLSFALQTPFQKLAPTDCKWLGRISHADNALLTPKIFIDSRMRFECEVLVIALFNLKDRQCYSMTSQSMNLKTEPQNFRKLRDEIKTTEEKIWQISVH